LTTTQAAVHFGVAPWQIRAVADAMEDDVPRAGLYRLIPTAMLDVVEAKLRRRGWLKPKPEVAHAS
jgi:hypothetical protein